MAHKLETRSVITVVCLAVCIKVKYILALDNEYVAFLKILDNSDQAISTLTQAVANSNFKSNHLIAGQALK